MKKIIIYICILFAFQSCQEEFSEPDWQYDNCTFIYDIQANNKMICTTERYHDSTFNIKTIDLTNGQLISEYKLVGKPDKFGNGEYGIPLLVANKQEIYFITNESELWSIDKKTLNSNLIYKIEKTDSSEFEISQLYIHQNKLFLAYSEELQKKNDWNEQNGSVLAFDLNNKQLLWKTETPKTCCFFNNNTYYEIYYFYKNIKTNHFHFFKDKTFVFFRNGYLVLNIETGEKINAFSSYDEKYIFAKDDKPISYYESDTILFSDFYKHNKIPVENIFISKIYSNLIGIDLESGKCLWLKYPEEKYNLSSLMLISNFENNCALINKHYYNLFIDKKNGKILNDFTKNKIDHNRFKIHFDNENNYFVIDSNFYTTNKCGEIIDEVDLENIFNTDPEIVGNHPFSGLNFAVNKNYFAFSRSTEIKIYDRKKKQIIKTLRFYREGYSVGDLFFHNNKLIANPISGDLSSFSIDL